MTEQVDLDALIAEAKRLVLIDRTSREPVVAMLSRATGALESTLAELRSATETGRRILADATAQAEALRAELRQERERADEAANHAELALAGRRNAVDALSRAEETIEKVRAYAESIPQRRENDVNKRLTERSWLTAQDVLHRLTEYDKQKGADRG